MPKKVMLASRNLLLFLCPLLAASCSSGDYNESTGAQSQAATTPAELDDSSVSEGGRTLKQIMANAPDGWELDRSFEGSARFNVLIDDEKSSEAINAQGYIATNGALDSHMQPLGFAVVAEATAKEKYREEAKSFPDIVGYSKFADRRRFGFNARLQMPLLSARYVNRDVGIFCRMNRPGEAKCVWGEADGRFLLTFDSLKSETVLPYILDIAKQGR